MTSDKYYAAYNKFTERWYSNKRLCVQGHWCAIEHVTCVEKDNPISLRHLLDTLRENLAARNNFPIEH